MSTTEVIARLIAMLALVGGGLYAVASGLFLTRMLFAFSDYRKSHLLPLIMSAVGALIVYFGFYISPFEIAIGGK